MAKIISVVNQKGGTGKSACAANLGVGLALMNEVVFAYKDDSTPIVEVTFDLTNDKPEVPQTTEGTPGTPSAGNPKTGDETNLWLPVVLLAVSVSGIAGLLAARRKRKRK